MKVNSKAKSYLSGLVRDGKISEGDWSFSSADGNKLLGADGDDWTQYGRVHLAVDTDAEPETKAYYKFPVAKMVGDEIQIFRRGVIAAKSAAAGGRGAPERPDIEKLADDLLTVINEKLDAYPDKKKRKMSDSFRLDYLNIPEHDSYMEEKFARTPEGFLKGRAIVTNVGVFQYRMPDGSVRGELRPPEEVFASESMESLKGIPLANEHPKKGLIDIDNIRKEQAGYAGDEILRDEYHLSIPLTWTDGETIEDIREGKRALSCGYTADVENASGVWMGMPYDAIQRNIRYNHIVLTDKGRAGDNARIKIDSDYAEDFGIQENKKSQEGAMSMKKIKIDGVEYEAEAPVITAFTQTQKELEALKTDSTKEIDTLKNDNTTLSAERDSLKDEVAQLKEDAKKFEDSKNDDLEKAVQARLVLLDSAKRAEIEVKEDMSEMDVKRAVILKLFPNSKEKMDSADDTYINVRYEIALEKLDEKKDEDGQDSSDDLKGDSLKDTDPDKHKHDSKSAYQRMVKRDQDAYKKPEDREVN